MKPDFVDNQDGNTLERAIVGYLSKLRSESRPVSELWIASAYFNPEGLELLSSETQHVPGIRILLGADPTPEAARPLRKPGDPKEPEFTRRQIITALVKIEEGLKKDRNLIPFSRECELAIRRLLEFLKSGKVEVRRYKGHFLHAKAFIFRGPDKGFLVGSSNLTRAGMKYNLELNIGQYEDPLIGKLENWYEQLWNNAEPFDLAAIYEALLEDYDPYMIFMKVLWHLYGDELEEEEKEPGIIPVTEFQQHGVFRAKKILKDCGGVLIADGVGLGKTFIAGDIISEYQKRRQRMLLICPASLRDSNWADFINSYQLPIESYSYEQLANDEQLGGKYRHLKNPLEEYALVIVDEAHNYRNPDTPSRAAILRKLMLGPRRDLILMTATPVNNSLWDLYHLIRYFLKQDAHLANKGVLSIRERFVEAMNEDPFNLNPDLLYPIIDATTVKRTRQFVKKHYEKDCIRDLDGKLVRIRFPKPVPSSIKYNLDEILPGFFDRLEEILMPPKGDPLLTLARYKPENYPAGGEPLEEDTALVGLIRSALLKRFESSAYSFRRTLERMIKQHEVFLEGLKNRKVITREFLREWSAADEDIDLEELLKLSDNAEDIDGYNAAMLEKDVQSDLEILKELHADVSRVKSENSPKLKALVDELVKIVEQAKSDGLDVSDEQQKRKVIIFSYYEDTIVWIEEHLEKMIKSDPRLSGYKRRMVSVSGQDYRNGIERSEAVNGFAPISTKAPRGHDQDRFDLMLSTDVLAEGMNLQQCRNVINFDMPWNPMRLVQRHGRIDRINSPYDEVYLRTFFPDKQLDRLLNLDERIRRKLAQAAASIGVETSPIEHGPTGGQSFAETKEEIEKLLKEDPTLFERGGTESAAQTGEEYRQELRKALHTMGEKIKNLPWKAGSGMLKGKDRGYFFCAAVGDRIYLRFLPYRGGIGRILSEIGTCLRLIECTPETNREMPMDLMEGIYDAWELTKTHIYKAWQYETDPINLQPKVRKLNRDVAEFIRKYPPSDIEESRLHGCLDAIESPWSRREETLLREAFRQVYSSPHEHSKFLVEEVERIGIEPFQAPPPLPPIDRDEIHLICWMILEKIEKIE